MNGLLIYLACHVGLGLLGAFFCIRDMFSDKAKIKGDDIFLLILVFFFCVAVGPIAAFGVLYDYGIKNPFFKK